MGILLMLCAVCRTDDNVIVKLDRTKIHSVGVPAIGEFLQKIQVFKATADFKAASELYSITDVDEEFLALRKIVLVRVRCCFGVRRVLPNWLTTVVCWLYVSCSPKRSLVLNLCKPTLSSTILVPSSCKPLMPHLRA